MDDWEEQNQTYVDFSVLLDKNNVDVFKVAGTSESFSAFLVSLCSSEGILPLRIGAARTKIYI